MEHREEESTKCDTSSTGGGNKPGSWTIALACSWVNLFIFAIFRSSGVLYQALRIHFKATHAQAAWPITLASSIAAIFCLPAGFLSHYFTVRAIVSSGVILTAASVAMCYFANSVDLVILSIGVSQGIGIGAVACLLPVIISEYFGAKRAAACGLSYAGAGFGAFFFPLIFELLIRMYGLHTSMLIMGSIILISLIGSLLLKPLPPPRNPIITSLETSDRQILRRKLQSPKCIEAAKLMDAPTSGNESATAIASTITSTTASVTEEKEKQEEIVDQSKSCKTCTCNCLPPPPAGPVFHPMDSCINCQMLCHRKEGDFDFSVVVVVDVDVDVGDVTSTTASSTLPSPAPFSLSPPSSSLRPSSSSSQNESEDEKAAQAVDSKELSLLNEVTSTHETQLVPRDEKDEPKLHEPEIDEGKSQMPPAPCLLLPACITSLKRAITGGPTGATTGNNKSSRSSSNNKSNSSSSSSSSSLNGPATGSKMKSEDMHQRETFLQIVEKQIAVDARVLLEVPFGLISLTYIAYLMGNVTFLMILPDYVDRLADPVTFDIESNTTQAQTESLLTFSSLSPSPSPSSSPPLTGLIRPHLGVWMLSLFSVTDLIGRLIPGWLSYYSRSKWLSNKSLYIASICGMGLLFIIFPLVFNLRLNSLSLQANEAILTILTLSCGLVSGFQMILPPVLIAESLGPENTAVAFGFANCIYGILSFTRPSIIGFFGGSYDPVFYVFGSFALISCLAWLVEIIIPLKSSPSSSPSSSFSSSSPSPLKQRASATTSQAKATKASNL